MFLREATLTPFKQIPNYPRFKDLSMNIFHYVGLGRAVEEIAQRISQKICKNTERDCANRIYFVCYHLEKQARRREAKLQIFKEQVETLAMVKSNQYIEAVCRASCIAIRKVE